MRNEARLCFWCGNFYNDEGNYAWEPAEDEMDEAAAATAVGVRRLPKRQERDVTQDVAKAIEKGGRVDVGTSREAARKGLDTLFGQSKEEKAANVSTWMEKLKAKGLVTSEQSITR